jgi:uncharacterized membrane protein YphA (DoxX/SURF4 family)
MFSYCYNDAVAVLLVRVVTGILFFFQGYDKIFNIKIENVVRTFSQPLAKIHLPISFLRIAVGLSSLIELTGGFFLFAGLFRTISLFALSVDLIIVAFLFSSIKAMWDMNFFLPRIIFIVFLLLFPQPADIFALENLFLING